MTVTRKLPSSSATVEVSALPTGKLYLPDRWLFEDGDNDMRKARQFSPDFSFLISHPSGEHILFDLGMRKELENNPDVIRADYPYISPIVPKDATDLLDEGPVKSSEISTVVFSHLHFDHTGDPAKFSHATFVTGPGSSAATTPGYPRAAKSPFLSVVIEHKKYRELSFETDPWVPIGPFERAYDYFSDGSFYLIDTPGHMPGHLGALAHTYADEWVFLGGDCCHHRALLVGARPVSTTVGPNGTPSFHKDPLTAISTIEKVNQLQSGGNVMAALAHDAILEGLMPLYPEKLNGWKGAQWKQDIDDIVEQMYS
ncbi:beta-lactamase-like protein [Trichoderma afarasin]